MRKVLLALFTIIILGIGIVGYNDITDKPNEVINEENHSTEIKL